MTKAQDVASPNTFCERGDGSEHREGGIKARDMHKTMQDDSDRQHRAEKSCPPNEVEKPSRFRHHQGNESFQLREGRITSHSTATNSNPYFSNVPSRDDERCTVLPPHKRMELSRRTYRHRKFQDSIDPSGRQGEEGVSKMSIGEQVHVDDKFVSNAIELSMPLDSEDVRSLEPKNNESVKSLSSDAEFLDTFKHIQMQISNTSISGFLHTMLSSFTNQMPVCEMEDKVQDSVSPNNTCERGNEECYVEEQGIASVDETSDMHIVSERGRDSTEPSKVHGTNKGYRGCGYVNVSESTNPNVNACDGSVSSIDDGCSVLPPHKRLELSRRTFHHAPHKRIELSRRTFQQRKSQDSVDMFIPNANELSTIDTSQPVRDSFIDFEDYHSMQNWSDSKNEESVMSPSSDVEFLKSSTNDQTEMSKVNELREEIDEKYDKSDDECEGRFHLREEKLTPQLDLNCTRFPSIKARRRPMRDNSSVDFEDSKNEELVMSLSSDAEFLSSSTNDQMEMSKVNELREEIDEKYDKSKKLHSIPLREEKLTPQLDLNCTRLPSLKASKEG
ncbi:hypothetical protein BHM03_00029969 [Ensete ventricosum]|uniref:Uncharacterized protein n=1 Tax=Ensete ventricosum TaxID=4639 RepID=A0A445MIC3_ENSVE|nr:hypothetical protein BHM03_00029969 [Ensete ventricosum]